MTPRIRLQPLSVSLTELQVSDDSGHRERGLRECLGRRSAPTADADIRIVGKVLPRGYVRARCSFSNLVRTGFAHAELDRRDAAGAL